MRCYETFDNQTRVFKYDDLDTELDVFEIAKKVVEYNPDKIVFVKNDSHFVNFLRAFKVLRSKIKDLPELIVYIYGDFTLEINKWKLIEPLLIGRRLRFYVACESQYKLFTHFLKDMGCCEVISFPVRDDVFFPKKVDFLQGINKSDYDKVFIYTGRLSYLKNIDKLIELFKHKNLENSLLLLVGAFDDIGFTFNHESQILGKQYSLIGDMISIQDNVKLFSYVDSEKLNDFYNFADCFVSLSTYHDEDFGMSCIEAAMCNTPLITSAWGGYKDFKNLCVGKQIATNVTSLGPQLEIKYAEHFFENINELKDFDKDINSEAKENFSITKIALKIKESLQKEIPPFVGFNTIISKLAQNEVKNTTAFLKNNRGELISEYKEIYKSYVG